MRKKRRRGRKTQLHKTGHYTKSMYEGEREREGETDSEMAKKMKENCLSKCCWRRISPAAL